jgi:hypothetical protein
VSEEDGPANAIARWRAAAGDGELGELMDCFYCLSLWAAAPLAFAVSGRRRETPLVWLALSGAACLLERTTRERGAFDVLWEEPPRGGSRGSGEADAREPRWAADEETAAATRR